MSKYKQNFNNRNKILKGFSVVQNVSVPAVLHVLATHDELH